jgi:hypothetical protein
MLRLIAAGVLAIPALLWTALTIPVSLVLSIPAALLLVSRKQERRTKGGGNHDAIQKRQVVITGGSRYVCGITATDGRPILVFGRQEERGMNALAVLALLIFISYAEPFLSQRHGPGPWEDSRKAFRCCPGRVVGAQS